MNVVNAINLTAQIVKITNLQKGNLVKKVTKETYGTKFNLSFCIVKDILNDGSNTFLQLLEYEIGYDEIKPKIGIYGSESEIMELSLFPATTEEATPYFNDIIDRLKQIVVRKEDELSKSKLLLESAKTFLNDVTNNLITIPEYTLGNK